MYKNQLQELAQRSCFNLPSYSCIREGPDHAPRFKATVNFNGETFESPAFCSTLRQAEHAAAEVALNTLASRGPSRALAARVLDETGVYKNLLQETAHRAGLKLPVYTTVRSGPGHVPVFSCTVELAGMSFTGEPARTKKQAQKNAAMAAWSALKRLVQHGSSSSSSLSSSLVENRKGSEEQEQVVIARFLASVQPSELKINKQNDCQTGHERFIPVCKDLTPPTPSLYPMQSQNWAYPSFSPEIAIYQMWQQEQLLQLHNRLLTLQVPPAPPPAPPMLPYMQSVLPPNSHIFFPLRKQETVPVGPRITIASSGPLLCLSDNVDSDSVRGKSAVTIQEINEEKPEDLSDCSPSIISDPPVLGNLSAEARFKESHDDDKNNAVESKVENVRLAENPSGQSSHRNTDSGYSQVDFRVQSPGVFVSCHASSQFSPRQSSTSCRPPPTVMIRNVGPRPLPAAPPVRIRTMGPVSSVPRPHDLAAQIPGPSRMRTGAPSYSARPQPQRMDFVGMHPRFMAPAVRIRSVVPVCSAPPPARKMPTAGQEGALLNKQKNGSVPEDISTTSEFSKLRI
ncbi:double-stranded RNA-binding protein 2 [Ricinus communis]|uniref:double-stranded RNA-binding protein 2 n=1 Tax=Ricinus communis TaxID=3988 RepID=UPI00201B2A6B|nr:double-stranded RNA-binding protein 2 [Ricinus communis]XP_015570401.2 double-stranded RNA-binding protein 2 [Ricinus communis]